MSATTAAVLLAAQPPAEATERPVTLTAGTGVLALVLLVILRSALSQATATAHEGNHALFAVLLGGHVGHVKLHGRNSGRNPVTSVGGIRGLDDFLVTLAGYLGPSMFGLLGAGLLAAGETAPVLVLTLVLLGLLLLLIRNLFGAMVVSLLGGAVWVTLHDGSPGTQDVVAFTWVWVLLIGGVVDVVELGALRRAIRQRGGRDSDSDVAHLAWLTRIFGIPVLPGAFWVLVLLLATTAALVLGASLLTGVG